MFDWKIIAAVFIALIVVSYIVIGVPGIRDFFGGIASTVGDALESSPFGGLFSSSGVKKTPVELTLRPESFSLKPELPVNVSLGDGTVLNDFKGELVLVNGTMQLKQEGSSLVISPKLNLIEIEGVKLSRLELEGMEVEVKSEEIDTKVDGGSLEVLDFIGSGRISKEGIVLSGNVTRIRGNGWEIG